MKRNFALVVAVVVFSLSVVSQAAPGFYGVDDPNAPKGVKEASQAIYRYVVLSDDQPKQIKKSEFESTRQDMKKMGFAGDLVIQDINECERRSQEICVTDYFGIGTAFIVGENRDQMITVAHNGARDREKHLGYVQTPPGQRLWNFVGGDEMALSRAMKLRFALFTPDGKKVFDTRDKGDYAYPKILGNGHMVKMQMGMLEQMPADFMWVNLSHGVGNVSLKLRQSKPLVDEKLTIVGFPGPTNTRADLEKVPDSDGKSLFWSAGKLVDSQKVLQFHQGPAYGGLPGYTEYEEQALLFTDADATRGNSGSPVLDENGEVAGLLVGAWGTFPLRYYMTNSTIVISTDWISENVEKYGI
jgi:hypothetical protein